MDKNNFFDVIIIGGSYAGLAAALSLGRALRKVLVIDSGKPCNAQTPHSHNFLTHDGRAPHEIAEIAREQVANYPTVQFHHDIAVGGKKTSEGFQITTETGKQFSSKKLVFATGLKDKMPSIQGFAECWGISVLHCPYCHGYEVKQQKTGIIANGEMAAHYAELISNWTDDLVLFTNGKSELSADQSQLIQNNNIQIIENEIEELKHKDGRLQQVLLQNHSPLAIEAIYSGPAFEQHCDVPSQLECQLTEEGLIQVDSFQKTTVAGVYACGDNSNFRSVSLAVSSGSIAGVMASKDLIGEEFLKGSLSTTT